MKTQLTTTENLNKVHLSYFPFKMGQCMASFWDCKRKSFFIIVSLFLFVFLRECRKKSWRGEEKKNEGESLPEVVSWDECQKIMSSIRLHSAQGEK